MSRRGLLSRTIPPPSIAQPAMFLIRSKPYRDVNAVEVGARFRARQLARLARDRERQVRPIQPEI